MALVGGMKSIKNLIFRPIPGRSLLNAPPDGQYEVTSLLSADFNLIWEITNAVKDSRDLHFTSHFILHVGPELYHRSFTVEVKNSECMDLRLHLQ